MKAEIRSIHSPDAHDLQALLDRPENAHSILVQVLVGPKGHPGEESLDFLVVNCDWIAARIRADGCGVFAAGLIVVDVFDGAAICSQIEHLVSQLRAENWTDLALILGRYGTWEFEDYSE
ncbi:MAG: hypothetical protein KDC14_05440 [Planctomycetes bacterium]|nr:hypothetical protein [Planctomycetota bacterium]MCB9610609.1 hypothetical protein [Polyangiaceae bacterium]